MAAHGGADAIAALGNQLFVSMKRGDEYPIRVVDVRVKYEETVADLRRKVEAATGVPAAMQQLFWGDRELTREAHDARTMQELNLHTGFSLRGYDLREAPVYWPPVVREADGSLRMLRAGEEGGHTEGFLA